MKTLYLTAFLLVFLPISAQLRITKTTCNHQSGTAIVDTDYAFVGWQMTSDLNNDYQTAFQIEIKENGTDKPILRGNKTKSAQSQLFALPQLEENSRGYQWRVKVWNKQKKPSEWSNWQLFYIAPKNLETTWVGAISKADAKLPDGRWSNTSFKQQDFKDAWKNVDTLATKSIEILKSFSLSQSSESISNAVIYISGLGHYILNINGEKVSDAEFSPLWTDYNKTVYYNLYDITSLLRSTSADINLCALLGNGMYNVQRDGRYAKFQASYGAPKLFFQLIVNYKDGTQQVVKTDGTEHYRLSNITFNSIYGGESASFPSDNQPLSSVAIVEPPLGKLLPQTAPPVKIMEKHNVKSWHYADTAHTVIICDMGQNLAGFPEITYSNLTAGNTIKLTVAEKLSKDGLCDQKQTGRPHYYSIKAKPPPQPSPQGEG
ncbi:MAG: family 78 glycoside hydrolase catalytic domain, partial [Prevotella sp.]|nr:family 78 glycoside hydrolase catalytic domain [Prevotella sp.]